MTHREFISDIDGNPFTMMIPDCARRILERQIRESLTNDGYFSGSSYQITSVSHRLASGRAIIIEVTLT